MMRNAGLDMAEERAKLLAAIIPHVPFDGWSDPAFRAAVADLALDPDLARVICPRGAVDLAVEYHRAGDRAMLEALAKTDLAALKYSARVALAVRLRLELADRELVRRGAAVFALPNHLATGSALIWGTAEAIWTALGDSSRDLNWYTKRMTLSAVYSATVLYWMGDESEDSADSWAFLDDRIGNVMQFEKLKGTVLKNRFLKGLMEKVQAPAPRATPGQEARR
jgi:ubiquinone biosynthesis protein COQ9